MFEKIDDIYREAVRAFNLDTQVLLLEAMKNTYYQTSLTDNTYVILANGEYVEKNELDEQKNITIKLSEFISFNDIDGDGINDAAVILMAERPDGLTTYSLTVNLNRYFYYKNIPDKIIGNNSEVEISSLEIREGKIYLEVILNNTENTMIFGVQADQLFELQ